MPLVNINHIGVHNQTGSFTTPFEFEISFECLGSLDDDLEFKLVYVGSPDNVSYDQELDSILVGPVPVGLNKFTFTADAPDWKKIPKSDLVSVTAILLTCSYRDQEFVRVGWYVNNEYDDPELQEEPPEKPIIEKIKRTILADKPRVTKFPINWDEKTAEEDAKETAGLNNPTTTIAS
eukprot:Clim_evm11s146 gene=Clim_evmTU11s146